MSPASAQQKSGWDGTWSGTTERGGTVTLVVSGNKTVQYVFRGTPVVIKSSKATGSALTMTVGQLNGQVTLQRKGNQASYSYSDSQGGTAKGTLSKN